MNRRDFIKSLCATWFSLSLIKDYHLGWLGDRQIKEEKIGTTIPLPEYTEKLGVSPFVLDEITGTGDHFLEFDEMILWNQQIIALSFGVDPHRNF